MSRSERIKRGLLKVGELAERAGVLPSTIRFYTQKGLLTVAGRTPGGNYLYEEFSALACISVIRQMNGVRPILSEVRDMLESSRIKSN